MAVVDRPLAVAQRLIGALTQPWLAGNRIEFNPDGPGCWITVRFAIVIPPTPAGPERRPAPAIRAHIDAPTSMSQSLSIGAGQHSARLSLPRSANTWAGGGDGGANRQSCSDTRVRAART